MHLLLTSAGTLPIAWTAFANPNNHNGFRLDNKKPRGLNPRGTADEARFELAEGFALTRFRGVLLRPLGHSSSRILYASRREQATSLL